MFNHKTHLKSVLIIIAIVSTCSVLVGCRPHLAPVYNVNSGSVYSPPEKTPTIEGVRSAIRRGIGNKGWHIDKEAPGKIWASIQVEQHSATVLIEYNLQNYSIFHVASGTSFKYDPDDEIIHRRYNNWIHHLNNSINASFYL